MLKHIAIAIGVSVLLLFISCAKAPENEMQKATTSMDAAKMAEAETYAPNSYRIASDTLNAAMAAKQDADGKFVLFRSYSKAKALYINVEALANKAAQEAATEKEKIKNELAGMIQEAKGTIDSATLALKTIQAAVSAKIDKKLLEADIAEANSGYMDAQNAFAAGQYMTAKTRLEQASQKAQNVIKSIEEAKVMKAEINPQVIIHTNMGDITVEVFLKDAPIHAKNFLDRVDKGLYNSLIFHRVIPNFVIQGGDPTGTGYGAPDEKSIPDEKSPYSNTRGFISMARGQDASPSQFFINIGDNARLDGMNFSVFAKVVTGMDVVDKISMVPRNSQDRPNTPVTMLKVYRKISA
jgi:cyclophilin family peptidyl-prolyl cis-trans isomerase/ElaB/YqjD/DUF883 family membrane-anchored ribosome-binding protein